MKLPKTKYLIIGAVALLLLLWLRVRNARPAAVTLPGDSGAGGGGGSAGGVTGSTSMTPTQQTLTALMAQAGKNLGNAINGLNQPVIIKPLPPGLPSASTGTHDWVER
jgi:hypothetical protein